MAIWILQTATTKIDESEILVVLGGLSQLVQVFQIILIVGVRKSKSFVEEVFVRDKVSLQIAVQGFIYSLPLRV